MQNDRQKRLLELLRQKQDYMTSRELAAILQVSDRTIRSDVDTINRGYQNPPIASSVRQGYRLVGDSPVVMQEISEGLVREQPLTPRERCVFIIHKLLFMGKPLSLVDLQGEIYVSDSSIDQDLKRIRKMLEPYKGLKLTRSGEQISLIGEESAKRKFYKDLLAAEVQKNFLNLNQLAQFYHDFDLIAVKDLFDEVIKEYDYSINRMLFPMLILHAGTAIERMMHSNYLSGDEAHDNLEETIEYDIARTFFDRVSRRLCITVPTGEVERFTLLVMGRKASNYSSDYVNYHGAWMNMKKVAGEIIEELYRTFGVDFRQDEDLLAGLKMHLHGLVEREKRNVTLEDIFLEEIKRKYPMIFEMGIFVTSCLEKRLGDVSIAETESGFIALHLGAASERMNTGKRYRAVAIMPYNQSFSEMCVSKISTMFKERMEIVSVLHYFEEKEVEASEPDLILTTVPMTHKLEIPTVSISLFVDSTTESELLKTLNKLDKRRFRQEFMSYIGNLIEQERYYQNLELKTREEVIQYMSRRLVEQGIVTEEFEEVVKKREEMSPTSFVNTFAIPHAFGPFVKDSAIAVAQLKNPVKWGNFEVRLVMMAAVNENDYRVIRVFFDWVSEIINNPELLAKLSDPCDYAQFLEIVTG